MTKEMYDILSLLIQFFIAVGTISAVIVALWQSRSSLREKCILSVGVGVPSGNTLKEFSEYDDHINGKIILLNISNISMRTTYINKIIIEDILTKKGILFKTNIEKEIRSGDDLKIQYDLIAIYGKKILEYISCYRLAQFRLRFFVITKTGKKFSAKVPQYILEMAKAECRLP